MANTIFFDLDGTLTDSGPGIINCAQLALEHFHIPVPGRKELETFVGPPLRQSFQKFGLTGPDVDEAIRVFRSRYTTVGKFENSPYPGIPQLLDRLRSDGFDLYIGTSKPEVQAVEILRHFDLARYFTRICGAALDKSRETKAEVLDYLLGQVASPGDIVMVGDTAYDVQGAAVHGIPTLGVTWGYGKQADLESAGAAALAHTTQDLYRLLTAQR